jgi:hypothetical protein
MSDEELEQARRDEYRQERTVNLLRRQAHGWPPGAPARAAELADAEAELQRRRRERARVEAAAQPPREGAESDAPPGAAPKGPGLLMSYRRKPSDKLGAATTGVDVRVTLRMEAIPTSIAHLLDAKSAPLVTFQLKYVGDAFARLRVTTFIEGYSARATETVELTRSEREREVNLFPTFFPSAVAEVNERTRATLHVQIDHLDNDRVEQQQSFPIWLMPRTTAYLSVGDPSTDEVQDLTPYLAAYVTPNAEPVMQVLREAATQHPDRAMIGYQGPEEDMSQTVTTQVAAIYAALRARGITYINSVVCFGGGPTQSLQRIRLPSESLATRSANCIDGTVLMASLLEAATLEAGIVLVPGHAFLAFDTTDGDGKWQFVETTMLGSHDFPAALERGNAEAAQNQALAKKHPDVPGLWRLMPLSLLRTRMNILPME